MERRPRLIFSDHLDEMPCETLTRRLPLHGAAIPSDAEVLMYASITTSESVTPPRRRSWRPSPRAMNDGRVRSKALSTRGKGSSRCRKARVGIFGTQR